VCTDPQNKDKIYVGCSFCLPTTPWVKSFIYVSNDHGNHWSQYYDYSNQLLYKISISNGHAFIFGENGSSLAEIKDGGEKINITLPPDVGDANSIYEDSAGRLYLSTFRGMYMREKGTSSWREINPYLPPTKPAVCGFCVLKDTPQDVTLGILFQDPKSPDSTSYQLWWAEIKPLEKI
jgi:hypothetical protein